MRCFKGYYSGYGITFAVYVLMLNVSTPLVTFKYRDIMFFFLGDSRGTILISHPLLLQFSFFYLLRSFNKDIFFF